MRQNILYLAQTHQSQNRAGHFCLGHKSCFQTVTVRSVGSDLFWSIQDRILLVSLWLDRKKESKGRSRDEVLTLPESAGPLGLPLTDTSGVLQRTVGEINQRHAESVRSWGVESTNALLMPEFRRKLLGLENVHAERGKRDPRKRFTD